jgi:hypothetical protein
MRTQTMTSPFAGGPLCGSTAAEEGADVEEGTVEEKAAEGTGASIEDTGEGAAERQECSGEGDGATEWNDFAWTRYHSRRHFKSIRINDWFGRLTIRC